jgi:hypothetical protein
VADVTEDNFFKGHFYKLLFKLKIFLTASKSLKLEAGARDKQRFLAIS